MNKEWTGRFTLIGSVQFSQKQRRGSHGFSGTAQVYSFEPDDPKCKVIAAALITGVEISTMCSESGLVGAAILNAASLAWRAKNSSVAGEYDTFPEPIGCPAKRLQEHEAVQALTFYRK